MANKVELSLSEVEDIIGALFNGGASFIKRPDQDLCLEIVYDKLGDKAKEYNEEKLKGFVRKYKKSVSDGKQITISQEKYEDLLDMKSKYKKVNKKHKKLLSKLSKGEDITLVLIKEGYSLPKRGE